MNIVYGLVDGLKDGGCLHARKTRPNWLLTLIPGIGSLVDGLTATATRYCAATCDHTFVSTVGLLQWMTIDRGSWLDMRYAQRVMLAPRQR